MKERWIAYSVIWLLMGIEIYFLFAHWLSKVVLMISVVLSVVYLIFGSLKTEELSHPPQAVKMK